MYSFNILVFLLPVSPHPSHGSSALCFNIGMLPSVTQHCVAVLTYVVGIFLISFGDGCALCRQAVPVVDHQCCY